MMKETIYTYLGTNGTVTTPIHLEGIPAMIQYRLTADQGKALTNGDKRVEFITILKDELDNWTEVKN